MSSDVAAQPIGLQQLLPHRPPMLVLEQVLEAGSSRSRARLRLGPEGLYFEQGRFVPIWAIEIMAQGLAAGLGAGGQRERQEARGFLIGVEDFSVPGLAGLVPGTELQVEARVDAEIPPVVDFHAELLAGREVVARARLRLLIGAATPVAPPLRAQLEPSSLRVAPDPAGRMQASLVLSPEHPWLSGHFPGDPVLPAIGHLRLVEQALAAATGRAHRFLEIERARFQQPVRPGQSLALFVERIGETSFSWSIDADGRSASRGRGSTET